MKNGPVSETLRQKVEQQLIIGKKGLQRINQMGKEDETGGKLRKKYIDLTYSQY